MWLSSGTEKHSDTKLEEEADSRGNNEFCIDKGIECEWQEDIALSLWLGKEGRSGLRRMPYGLRHTRMIFFNGIIFQNYRNSIQKGFLIMCSVLKKR